MLRTRLVALIRSRSSRLRCYSPPFTFIVTRLFITQFIYLFGYRGFYVLPRFSFHVTAATGLYVRCIENITYVRLFICVVTLDYRYRVGYSPSCRFPTLFRLRLLIYLIPVDLPVVVVGCGYCTLIRRLVARVLRAHVHPTTPHVPYIYPTLHYWLPDLLLPCCIPPFWFGVPQLRIPTLLFVVVVLPSFITVVRTFTFYPHLVIRSFPLLLRCCYCYAFILCCSFCWLLLVDSHAVTLPPPFACRVLRTRLPLRWLICHIAITFPRSFCAYDLYCRTQRSRPRYIYLYRLRWIC